MKNLDSWKVNLVCIMNLLVYQHYANCLEKGIQVDSFGSLTSHSFFAVYEVGSLWDRVKYIQLAQ